MALGPSDAAAPPPSAAAPAQPAPAPAPSHSKESSRSSAAGAVLASSSSSCSSSSPPAEAAVRAAATEGAEAHPVPTKGANTEVGAERIHCSDNKNDDIEQVKLCLITIHYLASIANHLKTLVGFHVPIENLLTTMMRISGYASPLATRQGPSTAAVVTGTPANAEVVKRMKGLLGSMCSIADKLPMFCGPVLLWLLSNSGQNFHNPWMQVIIPGSLMMCFISFILLAFASKLKDMESIDGVLFKISVWLLLPVFLALWPGLCMILYLFAHTSKFILWPLGALFTILSVSFWYLCFYKEQQKILEELKGVYVPENVVLPENPESEAASAQGLHQDNSYTVQISGPSYQHMYCPNEIGLKELGS